MKNLLLVVFSVFTMHLAAAEASHNLKITKLPDEEPVGEEPVGCFGVCTAIVVGVGAWAATSMGTAVIGGTVGGVLAGLAVWGVAEGYKWYHAAPEYEMLGAGKTCASGKLITSWEECQAAMTKCSGAGTMSVVANKPRDTGPKGCYIVNKTHWFSKDTVEVIYNPIGVSGDTAMDAIHANPYCKKSGAAVEAKTGAVVEAKTGAVVEAKTGAVVEAEVAVGNAQDAAEAELEITSSVHSDGYTLSNKVIFLFLGAILGYAASCAFARKDSDRLLPQYELANCEI